MRQHDFREAREEANRDICRSYQNDVIMEITNINMLNRPSHLRKTEKIKNCLKEVKSSNEERREFLRIYWKEYRTVIVLGSCIKYTNKMKIIRMHNKVHAKYI